MTSPTLAHRELVTKHNTLSYNSTDGRISVRKHQGRFIVRIERYNPSHVNYMDFATMRGALIALDGAKGGLL